MVDCKLIELPSLRGNYNITFETNLKKSKHKKNSFTSKAKELWDLAVLFKIQIYLVEVNLRKSFTLKNLMSFLKSKSVIFRQTVETTLNLLLKLPLHSVPLLCEFVTNSLTLFEWSRCPSSIFVKAVYIERIFHVISFKIWIY